MRSGAFAIVCLCALTASGQVQRSKHILAVYRADFGNPEKGEGWLGWEGVDAEAHRIGNSVRFPSLGAYDSLDPTLIGRHCAMAARAGITGFIVPWSTQGGRADRMLPVILELANMADLRVAVEYSPAAEGLNAKRVADDLSYITKRFSVHEAWLLAEWSPVFFVSARTIAALKSAEWQQILDSARRRYKYSAAFFGGEGSAAEAFDGIVQANPGPELEGKDPGATGAWARASYGAFVKRYGPRWNTCVTLTPGRARRDAMYRALWEQAIAANPDCFVIESWNDWRAGTEIEPSREEGARALEITAKMSARVRRAGRRLHPR